MNNAMRVLQLLLVCAGIYLVIAPINNWPLVIWDEARLAQSTVEMMVSGNYLVPTIDGSQDLWSTKPPLMLWLQSLSCWFFGVGEFAIRFPSVLAFIGVLILILRYSEKLFKSKSLGIFAVFVFITMEGVYGLHAFGTGDYDGLLCLFTSWFVFSSAEYFESPDLKKLLPVILSLMLGVLTKGIVILIFVPVAIVYLFASKKKLPVFKFFVAYAIALVPFIIYIFYRELHFTGFIKLIWHNDAGGRFQNALSDMKAPFSYYVMNMIEHKARFWLPLFCLFIPVLIIKRTSIIIFLFFQFVFFLLIISISQTKTNWYDLPLYPLMSVLIAYVLNFAWDNLSGYLRKIFLAVLSIVFIITFLSVKKIVMGPVPKGMEMENLLKMINESKIDTDDFNVFNPAYAPQVNFYLYCLQQQKRNMRRLSLPLNELPARVLIYKRDLPALIRHHKRIKLLRDHSELVLIEVN